MSPKGPAPAVHERIWVEILYSCCCAAYCQNCDQTLSLRSFKQGLRSDTMLAHERLSNQMLITHSGSRTFLLYWLFQSKNTVKK